MSVLRPNNVIEKANMGHETAWRQTLKDNEIKTCIYLMYTDTFVSYEWLCLLCLNWAFYHKPLACWSKQKHACFTLGLQMIGEININGRKNDIFSCKFYFFLSGGSCCSLVRLSKITTRHQFIISQVLLVFMNEIIDKLKKNCIHFTSLPIFSPENSFSVSSYRWGNAAYVNC